MKRHADSMTSTDPGGFAQLPIELLRLWHLLPEHHLRLLPLIASFMPDAFPSQGRLAVLADLSRQRVNRIVVELQDAGLIRVERRRRENNGNTSCRYHWGAFDTEAGFTATKNWYANRAMNSTVGAALRHSSDTTATHPLSTPVGDRVCQPLELTGAVNPSGLHTLSTPTVDTNRQGNGQDTYLPEVPGQSAAADPAGPFPAAPGTSLALPLAIKPESSTGSRPADQWLRATEPSAWTPDDHLAWTEGTFPDGDDAGYDGVPDFVWDRPAPADLAGAGPTVMPKGSRSNQEQACDSLDAMRLFLAKRNPWLKKMDSSDLPGIAAWGTAEWSAYFWFKVSQYRERAGQPLTQPKKWGRLATHIKQLHETKTADQMLRFLNVVTDWFDVICEMNGGAGYGFALDESVLCHKLIYSSVDVLNNMTDDERQDLWQKVYDAE